MARSSAVGSHHTIITLANSKRLVLWAVVLVQLGFIGCIWLLQNNRSQQMQQQPELDLMGRVHFVRQSRNARLKLDEMQHIRRSHCLPSENINRYQQDFYQMKADQVNRSADYAAPIYMDLELAPALWCYREGTLNESRNERNNIDYLQAQPQCLCASGWHGRDCGQPEIIWRALMTHRRTGRGNDEAPLKLREASSTSLKRLYYMLELGDWEHINMELLELQLRTLIHVVDYFCIYYYVRERPTKHTDLTRRSLERQLDAMLISSYVLYQCENHSHCTSAVAYNYFRYQLWMLCSIQMQPTDLLLFGNGETVYAPIALKFLKYFAADVLPLRFRLKHNVYGFYWQHPERTRLQGVIGSVMHMHGDPQRMERQASYTLGDLNHYGGWSCELCMPPEQIVHKLTASAVERPGASSTVRLPNGTRSSRIDAAYVQQLMTAGMHLDGTTMLLRLRQQSEKYYAPETALIHSSQFGQLLVNLYDTNELDDVQEDED
ncbi:beta-1,4-mannosyl-glycoprotein 4-beta-N-acetylglucosaminyltransferase [Drosophila grimshawi]|uniref:GH10344 n=1 Tax=Drosophila grimshawi TaxID=7222 RepID=B4JA55_DROGR|nr:beta-1,4-mannosyl-glycoprotein 4-beta-N-acetylglucosaminyltransferase [Drosophila grimshawi]EDW03729.1 GH10344 [Drosophila grimshawi]